MNPSLRLALQPLLAFAFCCATLTAQQAGPTFSVPDTELAPHTRVIVYGDMRFTDPAETVHAVPKARQALVEKIAQLYPDAVQLTGDVPLAGSNVKDYAVYATETAPWRAAKLRIYPAIGNHELAGPDKAQDIENWWTAFPELRTMRWYSVALGSRIYLLQLDSNSDLVPGSPQRIWLEDQLARLAPTVDFVFIALHHPPVADIQTHIEVDHNPRPNEIALRECLAGIAGSIHARLIVSAGHIHNYERFQQDGITYLVSGGGGAPPYYVERTPSDLYQDPNFPIFHYIEFILDGNQMKATMVRIADPTTPKPEWQVKDTFTITAK